MEEPRLQVFEGLPDRRRVFVDDEEFADHVDSVQLLYAKAFLPIGHELVLLDSFKILLIVFFKDLDLPLVVVGQPLDLLV